MNDENVKENVPPPSANCTNSTPQAAPKESITSLAPPTKTKTYSEKLQSALDVLRRSSAPDLKNLPCRDQEVKQVREVILNGEGTSIFVYGKPGTGKTECLNQLLMELSRHNEADLDIKYKYINCYNLNTTSQFYNAVVDWVSDKRDERPKKIQDMIDFLEEKFTSAEETHVLLCDEVERLLLGSQKSETAPIHSMLRWIKNFKFVLIGISNNTERSAVSYSKNISFDHHICFTAYGAEHLALIIKERLSRAQAEDILDQKSILFIASKLQHSGDARFTLDIARKIVERAIQDLEKSSSPTEKISLAQVNAVCKEFIATSSDVSGISQLPERVQLLLCACLKLASTSKEFNHQNISTYFLDLCKKCKLASPTKESIIDGIEMLSNRNIITRTVARKKETLALGLSSEQITAALSSNHLCKKLLE